MIDPHAFDPTHAPTPFTATEIRDACPAGRTIRLLVERPGLTSYVRVNRFVAVDADGAEHEGEDLTEDGAPAGVPEAHRSSWMDLQSHASFPRCRTSIEEETIEIPVGRLDCLRYTVSDGPNREVFWFAKDKPGMPVRFATVEGDVVTSTVTMIDDEIVAR